jgi:LPXTG-motif cell wall-anchored protein
MPPPRWLSLRRRQRPDTTRAVGQEESLPPGPQGFWLTDPDFRERLRRATWTMLDLVAYALDDDFTLTEAIDGARYHAVELLGIPAEYGGLVEAEAAAHIVQTAVLPVGSPFGISIAQGLARIEALPVDDQHSLVQTAARRYAITTAPTAPSRPPPAPPPPPGLPTPHARGPVSPHPFPPGITVRPTSGGFPPVRTRTARRLPAAAVTVAAVTGTMVSALAPAASALSSETTPAASVTPLSTAEIGGVTILKKDPAGDVLSGATFTLLDSTGQQAAAGTTSTDGRLAFQDLSPGVYRLKETSSGSPLHDVVDDQDVIVTPGAETPLTIIDPFKSASVVLKAKDDETGKLLAGSTVNIGSGDKTILTLTTGSDGTASGQLPVSARTGSDFWARQVKAPAGYEITTSTKTFKAKPGDPVTVPVTNAMKTNGTTATPTSSAKPTPDVSTPGTSAPKQGDSPASSAPAQSGAPVVGETAPSSTALSAKGSLAHTGAEATPWLLGGVGALLAAGGGAVFAARRRRTEDESGRAQG